MSYSRRRNQRRSSLRDPHKNPSFRRLKAELLERRILLTAVVNVDPPENSSDAELSASVSATFDQDINSGTATAQTFAVHSLQRGRLTATAATVNATGATVTLDPLSDFLPGERLQVTATSGIQSSTGSAVVPHVWQFRAAGAAGSGEFVDSGQSFPSPLRGQSVVFGDVDGDGDLDTLQGGDLVWLNDGTGTFTDTGQRLQAAGTGDISGYAEFADLDNDGDLDVVGTASVHLNNGSGVFSDSGQNPFGADTIEVGDLDGDGDIDVMAGVLYAGNRVWLNNGSGAFTDTGQSLGSSSTRSLEFADLDSDGDLDAWVPNWAADNRVWMNDGTGVFTDSGQAFGGFRTSRDVALGDVDSDGDVDAVVANTTAGNVPTTRVYLNDGTGVFADSGQGMNAGGAWSVKLGDLDADGDLDIFLPYFYSNSNTAVWLNDGAGAFSDSGQLLFPGERWGTSVDLGDVDGDGDLDAWETNRFPGGGRLWINQNLIPNVTLSLDNSTLAEAGGVATVTAVLSAAHTQPVTVQLGFSGTATEADDFTASGSQIVIAVGQTSGAITISTVSDTLDEPDESVVVDVLAVTNGQETGVQQVTTTILDDDEPPLPDVTLSVDVTQVAEAAGEATLTVTLSETTTVPVTVDLSLSGTAAVNDYAVSSTQVVIGPGASTGEVTITAVQDDLREPDETVIVDIASVTGGNEDGVQQQTITLVDDDAPPSFVVDSIESTASGVRIDFNREVDATDLNLYDTANAGLGPADVIVAGASSGVVAGSLVMDASSAYFIKSGDPLVADTYTVTVRSGANGFKDISAMLLDGDGDGVGGDDYVSSFTIAPTSADSRMIGIPDFVRGPGQDVNLPAAGTSGIPITISEGEDVRAADIRIRYDPAVLEITGATAPAGGSVILNTTTTPGVAILVFFSSASLPSGSSTFINLQAAVPAANASDIYRDQQVLDLHAVTIGDGNDNEFPVLVDDALHFSAYFADVSGNGRINASDAAQVARFAALIDDGFGGSLTTDPIVVGDISGNGRINAADASRVAQFAALIDVPEIPPVPGGIQISGKPGPPVNVPSLVGPLGRLFTSGVIARRGSSSPAFDVVAAFGSQEVETPGIETRAVDAAISGQDNTTRGEVADHELPAALEAAIDELLSGWWI